VPLERNALIVGPAALTTTLSLDLNLPRVRIYGPAGIALSTSIVYFSCSVLIFVSIAVLIRRK